MADVPIPQPRPTVPDGQFTPVSWRNRKPGVRLTDRVYDQGLTTLYQWGPLQFKQHPLNVGELEHETGTDWARKPIVGAPLYREWVGEDDEVLYLHGELFPYVIGGMSEIEQFDAMRRAGMPNMLIRGKGEVLGWFVCEKLIRNHKALSSEGVGQQIAFEAIMARVPVPASDDYQSQIFQTFMGR